MVDRFGALTRVPIWVAVAAGVAQPSWLIMLVMVITVTVPLRPAAIGCIGLVITIWVAAAVPDPLGPVSFMGPVIAGSRQTTGMATPWYLPATMLPTLLPETTTRSSPMAAVPGSESPASLTTSPLPSSRIFSLRSSPSSGLGVPTTSKAFLGAGGAVSGGGPRSGAGGLASSGTGGGVTGR